MLTRGDLAEILGSAMIHPTKAPDVVEIRSTSFFADWTKLGGVVDAFLSGHRQVIYCPHEPDERGPEAVCRRWSQVATNTWAVPPGVTADDILHDPEYPHGWTIYAAPAPLGEGELKLDMAQLIRMERIAAMIVSDPDGTPWRVGLAG